MIASGTSKIVDGGHVVDLGVLRIEPALIPTNLRKLEFNDAVVTSA